MLTGEPRTLVNYRLPLLRELLRQGHQVTVGAPVAAPGITRLLNQLPVRYCPVPIHRAGLNPLADARTCLALRTLLQRERPDLLLSYTIKSVIYGSLVARTIPVPAIFSLITGLGYAFTEGNFKQRATGILARRLYRAALRGNRCVFFQNPDDRDLFLSLGLLRNRAPAVVVAGSGVDLEHFASQPPRVSPVTFLMAARFHHNKGVIEYVAAARRVKARHPAAIFRLLGEPDSNPSSVSPADVTEWKKEGVVEVIEWTDDIRPHLAASSVCVLPSYREGLPHGVLEAMAMGRPIITTDAPGCRETVREGQSGFLVPVKDPVALAAAMERFLDCPALIGEMGQIGRQLAEDNFDVRQVNATMIGIMGLAA